MNIDVQVEDFFALFGEDYAAKGNVIDVAKARGKLGMGVVKAARWIERNIDFAVEDKLGGGDGSPDPIDLLRRSAGCAGNGRSGIF
jgi:hypothetical protein